MEAVSGRQPSSPETSGLPSFPTMRFGNIKVCDGGRIRSSPNSWGDLPGQGEGERKRGAAASLWSVLRTNDHRAVQWL